MGLGTTKTDCPFYPFRKRMEPFPWERTGPGQDVLGFPKFDLTRFNRAYFDRMRARVMAAGERGLAVSVMLFEGWCVQFVPDATSHPFFAHNNINGISYGHDAKSIHTLTHSSITAVQEAYVRMIIDTVNDLDNVLYEIANESGPYSTEWQYHMIDLVKKYELRKPKQHLVGMSHQHAGGTFETMRQSRADWISPGADVAQIYQADPPPADGSKLLVADTDHLGASGSGDRLWVWKSFCRGLHTLCMDRYVAPDSVTDKPYEKAEEIRCAMGQAVLFSQRMDLRKAKPRSDLASTRFCLADPGKEYLVYLPEGGKVQVDLSGTTGHLHVEWSDPVTGKSVTAKDIAGGKMQVFNSPFSRDAVLYLVAG